MIDRIFSIFYSKLPSSIDDIMPKYDGCKLITCLRPYYMTLIKEEEYNLYEEFDYIASDGSYPLKINKWVGKPKSVRLSFDMSSMTPVVFNDMIKHDKSLFLLGAKPDEIEKSVRTIQSYFPELKIVGYHHGYIKDRKEEIVKEVLKSGANVCVIGMGAPLQDEMAVCLKKTGFVGTVYTCGGFIHQTTEKIVSFPEWANRWNIRFIYRWVHEKGVFARAPRQVWGCLKYAWWLKFKSTETLVR